MGYAHAACTRTMYVCRLLILDGGRDYLFFCALGRALGPFQDGEGFSLMVRRTLDFADDPLRATAVCDPRTGWADMVAVWASGWGRGKGAEEGRGGLAGHPP